MSVAYKHLQRGALLVGHDKERTTGKHDFNIIPNLRNHTHQAP